MKIKEIKISIDVFALIAYWNKLRKRRIRTVNGHKFTLKPDKPDRRDFKYRLKVTGSLPESTDMENIKVFDLRYDQGELGSCTANASCEAYRKSLQVNDQPDYETSRLFQYYNSRTDKSEDTGASIRDAFKAMNKYGICNELLWPYKINQFADQPINRCYEEALDHQTIRYEKISPVSKILIMDALFHKHPINCGIPVYESFESNEVARTGLVPMPNRCKEQLLGYHAICMLDYDSDGVWCLNSWGKYWGKGGTFHLTWDFVLKYASDIWVLYSVE
jgi:C1A family cysteine protease